MNDKIERVGPGETKEYVDRLEMFRKLPRRRGSWRQRRSLRAARRRRTSSGTGPRWPRRASPAHELQGPGSTCSRSDEGGRHTPFMNGTVPAFYFRTTDVDGSIKLPEGSEMVTPGDTVTIDVPIAPSPWTSSSGFAIRRPTVGAGSVVEIIK